MKIVQKILGLYEFLAQSIKDCEKLEVESMVMALPLVFKTYQIYSLHQKQ